MKYTTTFLALAACASAHIKMAWPVPFNNPTLNNSPLESDGSDFPCKVPAGGAYEITAMNQWNPGETKSVNFTGSAVHGGGSCQFSLTTDTKPTKDSQWKVIHSVIGGCPSSKTDGNLPADPDGTGADQFPVTLPKDLPSGQYTFSFSWLNKMGNREFYMNCSPIMVGSSGGSSASTQDVTSALGQLPDMFVLNLPNATLNGCSELEGQDFVYPDPGKSVVTGKPPTPHYGSATSGVGCAKMTMMGAGAGKLGSPAAPTGSQGAGSSADASQPAATSAAAAPPASSPAASSPGVFAPAASSVASGPQTSFTTLVVTETAGQVAPTGAPATPTQPAGTGVASPPPTASGSCVPCTNEGGVVCVGSSQFGLCDHGCAVPQALAAGMTCANGAISRRSVRRSRHFYRRHGSEMI